MVKSCKNVAKDPKHLTVKAGEPKISVCGSLGRQTFVTKGVFVSVNPKTDF